MKTNDFYKTINDVEKSYKEFNSFKEKTTKDKTIIIAFWIFFAVFSLYIFCLVMNPRKYIFFLQQNFLKNSKCAVVIFFILVFISYILYVHFFLKNTMYFATIKHLLFNKKHEIEKSRYLDFKNRLHKKGISKKNYPYIIEYYENKLQVNKRNKQNEFYCYITFVFVPFLVSYFIDSNIKEYILILLVLGILIIPPIMILMNIFVFNKKQYMYEDIVYYLKLQILINKSKKNKIKVDL